MIGGDGSLTGADTLRGEWSELLRELVASGEVGGPDYDAAYPERSRKTMW